MNQDRNNETFHRTAWHKYTAKYRDTIKAALRGKFIALGAYF